MAAQSTSSAPEVQGYEKGVTAYTQFGGTSYSGGHVLKLDSSVGYSFSPHFGIDAGVPIYFAASSASTPTASNTSNNGIGNPYVDLRWKFDNPVVNYRSMVTGYLPVGDFSTGRFTADWTNHFDRRFSRLTPFAEAGIGNTIVDSAYFDRPFTSLGFNAHVQGGATYDLARHLSVGGSFYAVIPSGEQKLYSRILQGQMNRANTANVTNGMNAANGMNGTNMSGLVGNYSQITGTADLARDHGFSGWVGLSPNPYIDLSLGYTRSTSYDLNIVSFNVGVNVGRLLRAKTRP